MTGQYGQKIGPNEGPKVGRRESVLGIPPRSCDVKGMACVGWNMESKPTAEKSSILRKLAPRCGVRVRKRAACCEVGRACTLRAVSRGCVCTSSTVSARRYGNVH